MTDYRIFGSGVSGPSGSSAVESFTSGNGSVGIEFYVNKPVYLKYAHIWRSSAGYLTQSSTNFQLYQVTAKTAFQSVKGGAGSIPGGNNGWMTGQTNPILLVPGVRYKMAYFVGRYVAYSDDQFWTGEKYANGVGNSVIFAPGAKQALSGAQMTYDSNAGYPNTDSSDTNFWVDITVTDDGFGTPLQLGASGIITRKRSGTSTPLQLGASGVHAKRAIQSGTAYLALHGTGRSFVSNVLTGVGRLHLGASGVVTHQASIHGTGELVLGSSGPSYKTTDLAETAELHLASPVLSDFYRGVADNVRDALLSQNWNTERRHFQEAAQLDAEALVADVLGGLFALSVGDRERAHDTIRHLRTFRVKDQQIAGGHYHNSCDLIGYKPYGTLGQNAHQTPPQVIDQALTWLAEIFKGNYGEPIGDDVDSLLNWHNTSISAGPSALYGGQFLNANRTIWTPTYKRTSRPQLSAAAWALLAASGANLLFPADRLDRPQVVSVVLTKDAIPETGNRHRLHYEWSIVDDVFNSIYESYLESRVDVGEWRRVFECTTEQPSDSARGSGKYLCSLTVPHPSLSTQFRIWIRARNNLYGEWLCSNVVTIYSTNSTLFPSPTTYPSPTTFPQG